jgi:hypothetical protein
MNKLPLVIALCAMGTLAACGRPSSKAAPAVAPDTAQTGTPKEQPGTASPADVSNARAQTWLDDFSVSSKLNPDGSAVSDNSAGKNFRPGTPVHVAMEVKDAPPQTPVKVIWFGPNNTKVGEEVKQVTPGEKYLNFTAKDTKAWKQGDYRAEIWVADEKVNEQEFHLGNGGAKAAAVDSSKKRG